MKEKNDLSLFIFRRDLRIDDNTGLILALKESKKVIPLFIFTPMQVSDSNKYKSSNAIQFMVESLYDLNKQIKNINNKCRLWVAYGDEIEIIKKIYDKINFDAIYINEDYTPYSKIRDDRIKKFSKKEDIELIVTSDILLNDTLEIYAKNGNSYYMFTPFYNQSLKISVRKPVTNKNKNYQKLISEFLKWKIETVDKYLLSKDFYQINDHLAVEGGRVNGLYILGKMDKFKKYKTTKILPSFSTTMLSAHNKFGTVSIREIYQEFKKDKSGELVKNLYWRDFYYYASIHFDKKFYQHQHITKSLKEGEEIEIKWDNDKTYFKKWRKGETGFPFVDAAMRELNKTGFMHNRGRLIVSHFLVKDLLVDWKYGERYFSKMLVDIDRAQNTGNWNWSASFGFDNSPFLRIFNPWSQSKKYDPECKYIKKWIPELKDVNNNDIHNWYKSFIKYPDTDYPVPIVDHAEQRKKFINFYKKLY